MTLLNKLTKVLPSLNNLKTKVDDLDVSKLKTVPIFLKKLSHVVDIEVVKNTKFNAQTTNLNNLEKKFLMQLLQFTKINTTQINNI